MVEARCARTPQLFSKSKQRSTILGMPIIEDYALIGDCQTAALVARNGSIDWLCFPRFDSGACFSALLGTEDHGRWLLTPVGKIHRIQRRYREGTLILETDYDTDD